MLKLVQCAAAISASMFAAISLAATPTLSLWANRTVVDTDGDGSPDLNDNAPGIANNQADQDMDQIGDVVDPTPTNSNPFLYDIQLGIFASPNVNAGGAATIPYQIGVNPPHNPAPGDWGHIDLDFGVDGIYDATWFGPLTVTTNSISIPASFFVNSNWDLNTPGTYQFASLAYAPGTYSQFEAYSSVTVVPEPAALAGLLVCLPRRRRR